MIVTFRSKAHADIMMFGDIAVNLLKLMGHSGTVPGALLGGTFGQVGHQVGPVVAHGVACIVAQALNGADGEAARAQLCKQDLVGARRKAVGVGKDDVAHAIGNAAPRCRRTAQIVGKQALSGCGTGP